MQGPFSKEFNIAQFKETGADILITKESGNAGGFLEKTDAARECGMKIVVLVRVKEEGLSIEEAQDILRSRCL
jgi:precorrin-6x reductase